jgi:membrane protein required for colicin V production
MNWLDWILLVVIASSIIASFRTGFLRELIGLISMVVALFWHCGFTVRRGDFAAVSSRRDAYLCLPDRLYRGPHRWSNHRSSLRRLVKAAGLGLFDRVLGAGFGAVRGLLFAVALILAIVAFSPGGSDAPPGAVVHSRFAPYVIDTAHLFATLAPRELKDNFRKHYGQVKSIWDEAVKKNARHPSASEV